MSALDLFLPLAKVDLDRRLVTGVATAETPDRSGEIFDYASSKPYFEKWSVEAAAATGGKSFGAVRAMHTPIAAGKLTDIAFDDEAKRITVVAKIVDDDQWRKVQEGVYTGFSQGGRYVKRWADGDSGLTRYTADPHEISLVDLHCVAKVLTRRDYYRVDWPVRTRRREFGVYTEEVLAIYASFGIGILTNIGNG